MDVKEAVKTFTEKELEEVYYAIGSLLDGKSVFLHSPLNRKLWETMSQEQKDLVEHVVEETRKR